MRRYEEQIGQCPRMGADGFFNCRGPEANCPAFEHESSLASSHLAQQSVIRTNGGARLSIDTDLGGVGGCKLVATLRYLDRLGSEELLFPAGRRRTVAQPSVPTSARPDVPRISELYDRQATEFFIKCSPVFLLWV